MRKRVFLFPEVIRVVHVRIARATNRLPQVVAFYRDVLGLEVLAQFDGHEGFDGVMLGRRGSDMHFEFTHENGAAAEDAIVSPETLVIFYLGNVEWARILDVVKSTRASIVRSHNPYWDRHGITVEDPDGYRVVLHRGTWRI